MKIVKFRLFSPDLRLLEVSLLDTVTEGQWHGSAIVISDSVSNDSNHWCHIDAKITNSKKSKIGMTSFYKDLAELGKF